VKDLGRDDPVVRLPRVMSPPTAGGSLLARPRGPGPRNGSVSVLWMRHQGFVVRNDS
jgi:hypothetical protein